nr:MAG TPA: hypothetical protein [Caudoviricetes sp.]
MTKSKTESLSPVLEGQAENRNLLSKSQSHSGVFGGGAFKII